MGGYNYDIRFVMRHQEVADRLISAWRNKETLRLTSDSFQDINRWQKQIRNLLASIEFNYQGCKGIRGMRTWSIHGHEHGRDLWSLYVGHPDAEQKIVGRRPTDNFVSAENAEIVKVGDGLAVRDGTVTTYKAEILSSRDLTKLFDLAISEARRGTKKIIARSLMAPSEETHGWFFKALANEGWSVYTTPAGTGHRIELVKVQQTQVEQDEVMKAFDEELRKLQGELP